MTTDLRREALALLDRSGAILDTAREVSRVARAAGIDASVIGGVAVVLHGHVRTTMDVDVLVTGATDSFASALRANGFEFDAKQREFSLGGIPVHPVTLRQVEKPARRSVEIDGVRTVSLADLVAMKLRSGSKNLLRAQDLADVIGLMRAQRLRSSFARNLDADLRPAFRELARALAAEERDDDGP